MDCPSGSRPSSRVAGCVLVLSVLEVFLQLLFEVLFFLFEVFFEVLFFLFEFVFFLLDLVFDLVVVVVARRQQGSMRLPSALHWLPKWHLLCASLTPSSSYTSSLLTVFPPSSSAAS